MKSKMTEEESITLVQLLLKKNGYDLTRTTNKFEAWDLENIQHNERVEVKCRSLNHDTVLFYNANGMFMEQHKMNNLVKHKSLYVNVFDTDKGVFIVAWSVHNICKQTVEQRMCAKSSWEYNTKVLKNVYLLKIEDTEYIYYVKDGFYNKITFNELTNFNQFI